MSNLYNAYLLGYQNAMEKLANRSKEEKDDEMSYRLNSKILGGSLGIGLGGFLVKSSDDLKDFYKKERDSIRRGGVDFNGVHMSAKDFTNMGKKTRLQGLATQGIGLGMATAGAAQKLREIRENR